MVIDETVGAVRILTLSRPERLNALTAGIVKNLSWWTPDSLATYSGPLWELDPVEVVARLGGERIQQIVDVAGRVGRARMCGVGPAREQQLQGLAVGRAIIESMRIDDAHHFFGIRLNVFTALLSWTQFDAVLSAAQRLRVSVGADPRSTDHAGITAFTQPRALLEPAPSAVTCNVWQCVPGSRIRNVRLTGMVSPGCINGITRSII